ncbi:M50 family metallopeptidase, partial [Nonomuraea sp. NPDC049695]|uniref:M50 family metallopeptidase n=1 Tax=Nonomuraea sp. NPDC049695 TaxID=3154734 RepID=UPI0034160C89
PPRPGDDPTKLRSNATGPFQGLIESARDAAQKEVLPGDDRVSCRKKWLQKVIIMSGGPLMNFVLAFVFSTILLVGIGLPVDAPIVSPATRTCVIPVSEQRAACEPGDQLTPAAQAGLKPGDHMVSFNGQKIGSWDDAVGLVRSHGPGPVKLGIVRDGKPTTFDVTLIAQDQPNLQDPKKIDKHVIAKVLPLTYAAALVMMITAGLLVYADLVNPLTLTR